MAEYRLKVSALAEQDLRDVYAEGFETWGEQQADRYYDDLIAHFGKLCENPYLYMAVDDIRAGYRRSVCGKHAVYYRIQDDSVEIMAVLKRQNPFTHLP